MLMLFWNFYLLVLEESGINLIKQRGCVHILVSTVICSMKYSMFYSIHNIKLKEFNTK